MQDKIQHNYFYQQSVAEVWAFLTESELIAQWLMPNDFKAEAGHEFQFHTRPMPNFGFDGTIYCKVLEIVPMKKLVYSWKGGPEPGVINLDTVVTWELQEKGNGTELSLLHSGFTANQSMIMGIMTEGWLKNMAKIADLLNAPTS